jgi:protein-disulfide isomerase
MLKKSLAAVTAAALAGTLLLSASPARAQDKLPTEEVEQIVREYLLREPEIIYQAIQELQKRQQAAESSRQKAMIAQHGDDIFRHRDDPVAGNQSGDVTLVEFFDYRCGYCRSMSAGLRSLIKGDEQLRFVFKELPVLGPDSVTAAKAALAAAKLDQERYPDFHFALMQSKDLSQDAVLEVAARQGYDRQRLEAEMAESWVQARIDENLALAEKLGISGTPSFVVGETLIPGAIEIGQLAQQVGAQRAAKP